MLLGSQMYFRHMGLLKKIIKGAKSPNIIKNNDVQNAKICLFHLRLYSYARLHLDSLILSTFVSSECI